MPAVVVVGTQWGDEGKGKATDQLGQLPEHPAIVAAKLLELEAEGAVVAAHADEDDVRLSGRA